MIDNIRIIGFTTARSGSSYLFQNISNYLRLIHMNGNNKLAVKYLGECFHPDAYRPGTYSINADNQLNIANDGEYAPASIPWHVQRKKTREMLHILETVKNPIVAKVFVDHLMVMNAHKFWNFMHNSNHIKIFLYRNDLEDRILSKIFAINSGQWKTNTPKEFSVGDIVYDKEDRNIVKTGIQRQRELFNCYDHVEWDHVIKYESLSGSIVQDMPVFFPDVDLTLLPSPQAPYKKLLSKQEKINILGEENYSEFYNFFIKMCDRFEVEPYGDPV
jgi:hypothetical protein